MSLARTALRFQVIEALTVEEDDQGRTVFRQRALYLPRGLAGMAYWWAVTPFHGIVFGGMQRNIAAAAEQAQRSVDAGEGPGAEPA